MARNNNDDLSVMGFEGRDIAALADDIQENLIDAHVETHMVNIAERYFFQPQFDGAPYTALIFYSLTEKPAEDKALNEDKPTE